MMSKFSVVCPDFSPFLSTFFIGLHRAPPEFYLSVSLWTSSLQSVYSQLMYPTCFIPEDGGRILIRNDGIHLQGYMVSRPWITNSEQTLLSSIVLLNAVKCIAFVTKEFCDREFWHLKTSLNPHVNKANSTKPNTSSEAAGSSLSQEILRVSWTRTVF
jgi:hypothetical protein